jgi:hypothetical protein
MSFRRSSAVAGLLAGGLALSLVAAAAAPAEERIGTARTSLLGAELEVTGLAAVPLVKVMDLTTFATTDPDAAGNPVAGPFASTVVVPLALGAQQVGAVAAASNGQTSASSGDEIFGGLTSPIGVDVAPITASATATADRAIATVDSALAEVTALLGQLGLDLDLTGVTSIVNGDGAAATQGLEVTGLDLGLGDLGLGPDVLAQLPLGDLLELLSQLPLNLPANVQATIDAVLAGLADVQDALAGLASAAGPVEGIVSQITSTLAAIADLEALLADLTDLETTLNGLDPLTLAATLPALLAELATLTDCAPELDLLDLPGTLTAALTCVTDTIDEVTAEIAALEGVLGDLVAALDPVVAALTAALDALLAVLTDLLDGLGGLTDLLAQLPDLLNLAAGNDLLSVGAFDVGVSAIATDKVETSDATLLCSAVDVSILGQSFETPDCSQGLEALSGVAAAISGAVDQLRGVLNALPLADLVQVGEIKADLFTDVVEKVEQVDGKVVATAGFNLLELQIPSITLDPSAISGDLLGGLELPDVLAEVQAILDQVTSELEAVVGDVPEVGDVLGAVGDLASELDPTGAVGELVGTIEGLLGGLELGDLLSAPLSTPGLRLAIDPVSTAEYAVAAAPAPAPTPTPAPAPAPAPTPTPLPSTGGGAALLAILAFGGALTLRRRL